MARSRKKTTNSGMNSPASKALSQRLERLASLRSWRQRCKKAEIQTKLDEEIKMNERFEKLAAKFCPPNASRLASLPGEYLENTENEQNEKRH